MSFSDEVISILDHLAGEAGVAIDWTKQNVMPVISDLATKYIRYEIATSTAWIIIVAIIAGVAIFLFRKCVLEAKIVDQVDRFMYTLFLIVIVGAAFSYAVIEIFNIITCLCFPELQIIRYLEHLKG